MTYASADDLRRPALGLPARALEGVSPADLADGLEAASRLADSYLAGRYALPLTAWGADLRWAVAAVAAYNLLAGRGFNPQPGTADEQVRMRFEDALRWLRDAAAGRVTPTGVADSGPPGEADGDAGEPVVASDPPRGW